MVLMALLGAEEFAIGTAALIVLGCVMMRKCNLNTCPMGVATQNPELRKHFIGRYEYLVNYFSFIAQEVREYLAEMGFRSLNDIVGHTELIETKNTVLDLHRLLYKEEGILCFKGDVRQPNVPLGMDKVVLDKQMLDAASKVFGAQDGKQPQNEAGSATVNLDFAIKNTNRAVGAMLSGAIAKRFGLAGLPDDTVNVKFKGSAGQSFGAFLAHGVSFKLEGETNDYFAKGLCGGRIAILPPTRVSVFSECPTLWLLPSK